MLVLSAAAIADTTMFARCHIASWHFDILSIPTQLREIFCEYTIIVLLLCCDGPVILLRLCCDYVAINLPAVMLRLWCCDYVAIVAIMVLRNSRLARVLRKSRLARALRNSRLA